MLVSFSNVIQEMVLQENVESSGLNFIQKLPSIGKTLNSDPKWQHPERLVRTRNR